MTVHSTCQVYMMLRFYLLVIQSCLGIVAGSSWTYTGPHGQEHWAHSFPDCGGTAQSPINIQTANVSLDTSLPPIEPEGYTTPGTKPFTLRNNGHTVVMSLPPSMYLRGLPKKFTAVQLHLHWGSKTNPGGSEHQIDNEIFPAELHIVHYNSDNYANISQAQDKPDGLAVLGILIETGIENNAGYDNILRYLENVRHAGDSMSIPSFDIQQLFPENLNIYYRYRGSLTTPPCYQSVLWTVFHQKARISESQLEALQKTLFSTGRDTSSIQLENNVRVPQSLNQRKVYISTLMEPKTTFPAGKIVAIIFGILGMLLGIALITLRVIQIKRKNKKEMGEKPNDVVLKSPSSPVEIPDEKPSQP
ncbi:carbonic anhydrase 14 [Bombina bombina]|uniref:carbonic anhydrase 14 n=1 Tax=Bombina bombina TaxID=8345 RepID=UPI00235A47C8|nr:carbonic anhydrase 14 [Bombina bombina]